MKRLNDYFPDNVRFLVSPLRKKPAAEELMMSSGMFEQEFSETLPTQRVIFLPTIAAPATANIAAPILEKSLAQVSHPATRLEFNPAYFMDILN